MTDQRVRDLRRILKPQWRKHAEDILLRCAKSQLSANSNPKCIRYVISHGCFVDWRELNANPSDFAVRLSLHYIDKVHWTALYTNPNPLLVDKFFTMGMVGRPELVYPSLFCNPNPRIVEYILSLDETVLHTYAKHLSFNTHPDVVNYLIRNPELISFYSFSANPCPLAVQYLLDNPGFIKWNCFNQNESDLAVDYLLSHTNHINVVVFVANANLKAVHYTIRQVKTNWDEHRYLIPFMCRNKHPRMADFIVRFVDMEEDGLLGFEHIVANPGLFLDWTPKIQLLHWWTHDQSFVLYRIPLELIRMICDFI